MTKLGLDPYGGLQLERNPKFQFQWQKLTGEGKYRSKTSGQRFRSARSGRDGVARATSQTSPASELIKAVQQTHGYGVATDNLRVQRLMGINSLDGKDRPLMMETIPSGERSMFSCERYQFFLDAPFEIGQQCCNVMKKSPSSRYHKQTGRHPITAMMATESKLRTQTWLLHGCNAFDSKKPISNPMSFWTEQDVLLYIRLHSVKICSLYGDVLTDDEESGQMSIGDFMGLDLAELFEFDRPTFHCTGLERTGCMFCGFGAHREKSPNRFERMKITHPKQYDYIMRPKEDGGLGYKDVIDWINEHGNLNIKY